ncbi:MAG: NAD(P)H-hydrate dehydratase [Candidatus Eremiobacteraeota bacterium]|nr:NAD(P)H-hydrate dehydratase [Candidatus Eremiobacteraeota bacterium]
MIYVLTPEQMHDADAAASAQVGADTLMRAAGKAIAARIAALVPPGKIVAFAGPGNNGGDAFAALAELDSSYDRIVCAAYVATKSDARRAAEGRALATGVVVQAFPRDGNEALEIARDAVLTVDGLLGVGARLPVGEDLAAALVALDARERPVVAIDIPSGCDGLTGATAAEAVRATETIALGAYKPGLLLEPARTHVGTLRFAQIGMEGALLASQARTYAAVDDAELLALLPKRSATSDKRGAGAPLVVAGSTQFPGAAVLCARAAARSGAGYVTVATSARAAHVLRQHLIEQVVVAIDDGDDVEGAVASLVEISSRNGSIAIGPGLGLDDRTGAIVRGLLERTTLPCVVDASGLFHLAKHLELLRDRPVVVTPHAGEFARLSGQGTIAPGERVARLREFVERTAIVTLLKGPDTLIYDGTTMHLNASGCSALATAGSGDVLTGMIATLLSQGLAPVDAARLAAYWHGRTGELLARERRVGVVAGDLPDALARALP